MVQDSMVSDVKIYGLIGFVLKLWRCEANLNFLANGFSVQQLLMVVFLVFNICILMLGGLYGNCLTGWTTVIFLCWANVMFLMTHENISIQSETKIWANKMFVMTWCSQMWPLVDHQPSFSIWTAASCLGTANKRIVQRTASFVCLTAQ